MPMKKRTKLYLPIQHIDYSNVKPPKRLAIYAMIENLHAAANK